MKLTRWGGSSVAAVSSRFRTFTPLIFVLLLVMLTGCGEPECLCPAATIPALHLPGMSLVSAFSHVLESAAAQHPYEDSGGYLEGITTYRDANGTSLALISVDGQLYALDLAASAVAPVGGVACVGPATLTMDRAHLACVSDATDYDITGQHCGAECTGTQLSLLTLSPNWPPVAHLQVTLGEPNTVYYSPSWTPDGQHLAVSEQDSQAQTCAIAMYALTSAGTNLAVTGRLDLKGIPTCSLRQIAWAPDGDALAMLTPRSLLVLPRTAIPRGALTPVSTPVVAEVVVRRVDTIFAGSVWMAWTPDSRSLTVLDLNTLNQVALATAAQTPLFELPEQGYQQPYIGAFAWLPNGQDLLFAFGPREVPPTEWPDYYDYYYQTTQTIVPNVCFCPLPPTGLYLYNRS